MMLVKDQVSVRFCHYIAISVTVTCNECVVDLRL